jgi:glucose/arabinose dehydrogenase
MDALPPTPEWGSVLQFNLDGSGRRIYARGMRNTVGLTLHPVTNELWARTTVTVVRAPSLLIQSQRRPVALVPAHLAPMGIHLYTGDLFPAQYHNAAFVAIRGARPVAISLGFLASRWWRCMQKRLADFVTGFGIDPEGSMVWGKPVGIASDPAEISTSAAIR